MYKLSSVDSYSSLNEDELEHLHELVFEREYNEKHPDDYFNAGGFFAHWRSYTDEERAELIEEART